MGVIFVGGIYGVGKSTICNQLSERLSIPHYSASDLITQSVGEIYGSKKYVKNADKNQQALIIGVSKILEEHKDIILSGHFCIFDKELNVLELPQYVYKHIDVDIILILESDINIVKNNLFNRDNKAYPIEKIESLNDAENKSSKVVSENLNITRIGHLMTYKPCDLLEIEKLLKQHRR